jgi:solute carrier family 41
MLSGELLESVSVRTWASHSLKFDPQYHHFRQRWTAMKTVNELIIIIPVMLNLKGNLEMNLSARLGTAANMGILDDPTTRKAIILGNLALLQVQAAVVSFVAACFSFLIGVLVSGNKSSINEARADAVKPEPSGHLESGLNE